MSPGPFEDLRRSGQLAALSPTGEALHCVQPGSDGAAAEVQGILGRDPSLARLVQQLASRAAGDSGASQGGLDELIEERGAGPVRIMGIGFSLALCNRSGVSESPDYDSFWSLALARATACAALARELKAADPREAFHLGLLYEVGALALARVYPLEYSGLLELSPVPEGEDRLELERGLFGIDHLATSVSLFNHHGFPPELGQAVLTASAWMAERPATEAKPACDLAACLWAADRVAHVLVRGGGEIRTLGEALGIEMETFVSLGERVVQEWGEWGDLLRIPTRQLPSFADLARVEAGQDESASDLMAEFSPEASERTRILAVDDDPVSLRLLTKYLESGDYEIFTARNGREALDLALHVDPQIIVSDWMMPEMDGLELCKALRRFTAGRHIFFILLTGREEEERVVEAFEAGVNDFVSKPCRHKLLLARVRASERFIRLWRQHEQGQSLLRRSLGEKSELTRKLSQAAFTDVLTDLPNRRYAMHRLEEEWSSAQRNGTQLSVIMVDIDFFKGVNDVHGHDTGDSVLRSTARVLNENTRGGESAARLGGEEFLIICPGSGMREAQRCGERVRAAVEANHMHTDSFQGRVTISVGVAELCSQTVDVDHLLRLADEAAYKAKSRGRNRVVCTRLGLQIEGDD